MKNTEINEMNMYFISVLQKIIFLQVFCCFTVLCSYSQLRSLDSWKFLSQQLSPGICGNPWNHNWFVHKILMVKIHEFHFGKKDLFTWKETFMYGVMHTSKFCLYLIPKRTTEDLDLNKLWQNVPKLVAWWTYPHAICR